MPTVCFKRSFFCNKQKDKEVGSERGGKQGRGASVEEMLRICKKPEVAGAGGGRPPPPARDGWQRLDKSFEIVLRR